MSLGNEQEEWYFSIVDVVGVLSESENPQTYWRVLKKRLLDEGNQTVTNCNALKIAGNTRKAIEEKSGKKIITRQNAKQLTQKKNKEIEGGNR